MRTRERCHDHHDAIGLRRVPPDGPAADETMTVVSSRITIEQRRARLGVRHHLAARSVGLGPADLAADLVVLHATDAASVYLSVAARATDLTAADIASALYDERTLIRMLGMRRTMFVVPTPAAAVVQHSSSAQVAARLRRALVKELGAVVDDPDPWLADVEDGRRRPVARSGRRHRRCAVQGGRAVADQDHRGGGQGLRGPGRDQQPGAEHPVRAGTHRPRPAGRWLDRQPVRVGADREVAARRTSRPR